MHRVFENHQSPPKTKCRLGSSGGLAWVTSPCGLQPAGGGRYEDFLCKIFLAIFDLWEELSKMSRESRQRLRGEAKRREMRLAYKKKLRWVLLPLTMALVAGSAFTWINLHPKPK